MCVFDMLGFHIILSVNYYFLLIIYIIFDYDLSLFIRVSQFFTVIYMSYYYSLFLLIMYCYCLLLLINDY